MTKSRVIIHGVIYFGIMVTFPSLPLGGIRFLWGFVTGVMSGLGGVAKEEIKEGSVDIITEIRGPLWHMLNPFQ